MPNDLGSVSSACPRFFRGLCRQARRSRRGYRDAGHELARHARDLVTGDVNENTLARLDAAVALPWNERGAAVVGWMKEALPRCLDLVPSVRRRGQFRLGVEDAIEEGLM